MKSVIVTIALLPVVLFGLTLGIPDMSGPLGFAWLASCLVCLIWGIYLLRLRVRGGWVCVASGFGNLLLVVVPALVLTSSSGESPLLDTAHFVTSFRDSHERLPTNEELGLWARRYGAKYEFSYSTNRPAGMSSWGVQGKDFIIGVRDKGTWVVSVTDYYCSWDGRTFDGYVSIPNISTAQQDAGGNSR